VGVEIDAGDLDRFCRTGLGTAVRRRLWCRRGVGAVFGLELADGRRVVVKAHRPGVEASYLGAVQAAQRHLAEAGIPAPAPLAGPGRLGSGLGTAETLLADGGWADPHAAPVRAQMAAALALVVAAGRALVRTPGLRAGPMEPPAAALWPTPHDPRFDFAADAAGAAWIDRIAERATAIQRESRGRDLVVGHTDWRVQNLRFDGRGRVCAVYDWDSLRVLPEPMLAGKQAANFTADWSRPGGRQYPSIDEALAFVADYEAARGVPFDDAQRRLARASLAAALAYISRCEHSDAATGFGRRHPRPAPPGPYPADSARSLLAVHAESLLAG
jgi:Ser/Thr protein kinase RdoA (MazF antagonist)